MCKYTFMDLHSVQITLMLGVIGFYSVTQNDIQQSFSECGLWPLDYRFLQPYEAQNTKAEEQKTRILKLECATVASRFPSVLKRKSDRDIWEDATRLMASTESTSKTLQNLEILLKEHRTVNRILMEAAGGPLAPSEHKKAKEKNEILYKDTPASCLTFGEILEQRKEREHAASAETTRKQKEAREKRKELEKVEKKAAKVKARQKKKTAHAVEIKRKRNMRASPRGDGNKSKLQLKKWSAPPAGGTGSERCDTVQRKSAVSQPQIVCHFDAEAQYQNEYQVVRGSAGVVKVHDTARGEGNCGRVGDVQCRLVEEIPREVHHHAQHSAHGGDGGQKRRLVAEEEGAGPKKRKCAKVAPVLDAVEGLLCLFTAGSEFQN
eukprot:IDg4168t1